MNTVTKTPSAGAIRAAKALLKWEGVLTAFDWAELIDRESGLAELLEAASFAEGQMTRIECGEDKGICFGQALDGLRTAMRKASNPNSTVTQSFPAGRWTEKKGTV